MKQFISSLFILFVVSCAFAQNVVFDGCHVTRYYASVTSYFYAYGDVYVETDPKEPVDLEVKVTNERLAQCWVYVTTDKPQDCGEWRFVKDRSKAKFTVRFVDHWDPDCTIRYVSNRSEAGCWGYIEH